MRLVLVEWLDALTAGAGWKSKKKLRKQKPVLIRSVGYLVDDHPDHVTIASSHSLTDDDFDGDVTVPRGMIVGNIIDLIPKE